MVIGEIDDEERLIASGRFGLIIYSISARQVINKITNGLKGFFGINYCKEFGVLLAATAGKICFYNLD